MLARAEHFPDFRGISAAAVYEQDKCVVEPATGAVSHSFSPFQKRGALAGAWARVERAGRIPTVVVIAVSERRSSAQIDAFVAAIIDRLDLPSRKTT
jgi:hypothetical protein